MIETRDFGFEKAAANAWVLGEWRARQSASYRDAHRPCGRPSPVYLANK